MIIYQQSTGKLWDSNGNLLDVGYSGNGEGLNNPKKQAVRNVGPIPRGLWDIGEYGNSDRLGPYTIPLYPHKHEALQRTLFRIHGDNSSMNNSASDGCIVLIRETRKKIINKEYQQLMVIE